MGSSDTGPHGRAATGHAGICQRFKVEATSGFGWRRRGEGIPFPAHPEGRAWPAQPHLVILSMAALLTGLGGPEFTYRSQKLLPGRRKAHGGVSARSACQRCVWQSHKQISLNNPPSTSTRNLSDFEPVFPSRRPPLLYTINHKHLWSFKKASTPQLLLEVPATRYMGASERETGAALVPKNLVKPD